MFFWCFVFVVTFAAGGRWKLNRYECAGGYCAKAWHHVEQRYNTWMLGCGSLWLAFDLSVQLNRNHTSGTQLASRLSSYIYIYIYKPYLELSVDHFSLSSADVLQPFSSSFFPLTSLPLTPRPSFPSFFSLFKPPLSCSFFLFLWLALNSWVMIVVKYGLGLFFTPSVYRAWVFLKADKMKEPFFPPSLYALQLIIL